MSMEVSDVVRQVAFVFTSILCVIDFMLNLTTFGCILAIIIGVAVLPRVWGWAASMIRLERRRRKNLVARRKRTLEMFNRSIT